ncbi:MAG: hypothetical protein CMM75_07710, partial [Rhodospirillaceae bacterium]|nr:hypothetical protein [Rhodospirillaceae bacterium]
MPPRGQNPERQKQILYTLLKHLHNITKKMVNLGKTNKIVHQYLKPLTNSNTFTAFLVRHVPELNTDLPPLAIGEDFLPRGKILGRAPSGTGIQISILGVLGILISADEGI